MIDYNDYMFPVSPEAKKNWGLITEGAGCGAKGCGGKDGEKEEDANVSESAARIAEAVLEAADTDIRSIAMTAALEWAQGDDHSYEALDEAVVGVAGLDGDDDITEADEEWYNDVWDEVPDALISLGADEEEVAALCDDEDSSAGSAVASAVNSGLVAEGCPADVDIIMEFAAGSNSGVYKGIYEGVEGGAIFEASYRKKKVVRDGKVVKINRRVSGKVRLSAAQKAGLRAARRKAFTAAAKLHRRKSMRIRKQRGM